MSDYKLEEPEQTEEEEKAFFDTLLQGPEAAKEAGCPASFVSVLSDIAEEQRCAIVIRGNDPIIGAEKETQPKPTWVHAKSSNWDFVKDIVPARSVISALGKKYTQDGVQKIVTTELHDIPDAETTDPPIVEPVPVQVSLDDIKRSDHTILSQNENEIRFIANDDPHSPEQRIIFKINLNDPSGDPYNLYCQIPPSTDFVLVEKLGMRNKEGKLLPIGKDQDICAFEIDKNTLLAAGTQHGIPLTSIETFNTFTPGGRSCIIKGLAALNPEDQVPDKSAVVQYGCATSYEASLITSINRKHNKIYFLSADLIQHGPENENPGNPSNINGKMLHIFINKNGEKKVYLTRNEKEFARLVKSRVGTHYVEVHPKWNMEHWASVIEKQLQVGYSINAETMLNYLAYKNNEVVPTASHEAIRQFINKTMNEEVTINGNTFHPLDRIYVTPIQNMTVWSPTIQRQLERLKTSTLEDEKITAPQLRSSLRPQALLAYHQHRFGVIDAITKGDKNKATLLKANYPIFETAIVDETLKSEARIKTMFIHPEFNLDIWLPVFMKQLELKLQEKIPPSAIDPDTRKAFSKLYEDQARIKFKYTPEQLSNLRHELNQDQFLLSKLTLLHKGILYERKTATIEEQETHDKTVSDDSTKMTVNKEGKRRLSIGPEVSQKTGEAAALKRNSLFSAEKKPPLARPPRPGSARNLRGKH